MQTKIFPILVQVEDDAVVQPQGTTSIPITTSSKPDKDRNIKRKKVGNDDRRDELISLACKILREPEDDNLSLANTWAHDISRMNEQQQLFAKKTINDILFEGQTGTLHTSSVKINETDPQPGRSSTPFSFISHGSYQDSATSNDSCHRYQDSATSYDSGHPYQDSATSYDSGHRVEDGNQSQLIHYFSTFQP